MWNRKAKTIAQLQSDNAILLEELKTLEKRISKAQKVSKFHHKHNAYFRVHGFWYPLNGDE